MAPRCLAGHPILSPIDTHNIKSRFLGTVPLKVREDMSSWPTSEMSRQEARRDLRTLQVVASTGPVLLPNGLICKTDHQAGRHSSGTCPHADALQSIDVMLLQGDLDINTAISEHHANQRTSDQPTENIGGNPPLLALSIGQGGRRG